MKRRLAAAAVAAAAGVLMILLVGSPAGAHPLGNFTINQYVGLTLTPDHVAAKAIVDSAEIPTLQERPSVDADGDGSITDAEQATHAARICGDIRTAVLARVGPVPLVWTVRAASFVFLPGAGGLSTSRSTCWLWAATPKAGQGQLSIDNRYLADRIGWREITANGEGVRLIGATVASQSVSRELTVYPPDLLSTSLDVRTAIVGFALGAGSTGSTRALAATGTDPLSRWMATVDRRFADIAGAATFTPLVALLGLGLALLLGAGHAALPGHGKTILAAYLAGKRGRPRDAWAVAGTVTFTHTGGVLVLGMVISAGISIAGERILSWLGLASSILVLGVGATMLGGLIRQRRQAHHDHHGHSHSHGQDHHHDHEHGQDDHYDHDNVDGRDERVPVRRPGRWGLAGIGIAGGLVPSPSALVVLLAAIGLGRTGFAIALVVAYGAGMALMLGVAGLALLAVQRGLARRTRTAASRLSTVAAALHAATPAATATLILLVGTGLAFRAATTIV